MKIRHGFVSNSSSTSFTIIGICDDADTIYEKLKLAHPKFAEDVEDYDLIDEVVEGLGLGLSHYIPYGEYVYIGLDYENIGDDETGKQFRERAQKEVSKLLGETVPVEYLSEAWRDG